MAVSNWSSTASSNTSVGGLTTDGNIQVVSNIDGMFRGMMADIATARDDGTMTTYAPRGYLHGLTLSNNVGDATNDIDIAVGECAADTSPYRKMTLGTAITKRLDAAWAVGTSNGGRMSAAAIADTTYHIWLIQRSDTGVVDVGFDVSATAPTMPANYDRKRRIGSVLRESATIVAFQQNGDIFRRTVGVTDAGGISNTSNALVIFSVPIGIVVAPLVQWRVLTGAAATMTGALGSASAGVATTNLVECPINWVARVNPNPVFFTNTSGQLYLTRSVTGAPTVSDLGNIGWVDTRGRT